MGGLPVTARWGQPVSVVWRARVPYKSFQVTLLQVEDLQRVATGGVLNLIASNLICHFPLPAAPRVGCSLIGTTATPPELWAAFLGAHSAGWKHTSNCPSASAERSTSISYTIALVPAVHDVIHCPRDIQCAVCATWVTFTSTARNSPK
jgi:hypothetical protein